MLVFNIVFEFAKLFLIHPNTAKFKHIFMVKYGLEMSDFTVNCAAYSTDNC
jgi:hypothetical protein